jgi:hypothetical protein
VQEQEKQQLLSQVIKANLPDTVLLTSVDGEKIRKPIHKFGTTGKRCRNCGELLPQANVDELEDETKENMEDRTTKCPSCNTICAWFDFDMKSAYEVDINPDEAHFLFDNTAVREAKWYHSTTSENWADSVKSAGVLVHAGTLKASQDRMNDIKKQKFNKDKPPRTHYLYELKVKPDSPLNKTIFLDDNDFPIKPETDSEVQLNAHTVSRYVNEWENPGSVSLISTIDNFEVVKRTVL